VGSGEETAIGIEQEKSVPIEDNPRFYPQVICPNHHRGSGLPPSIFLIDSQPILHMQWANQTEDILPRVGSHPFWGSRSRLAQKGK